MHILKKILVWLSAFFFSATLAMSLVVLPLTTHLTNRDTIKNWIRDTNIISEAVELAPELLANATEEEGESAEEEDLSKLLEESGIDQDKVIESVQEVITPEYVTEKLFPVIDAVYDWLEGKTPRPEFEVAISDRVTAVADNVGDVLVGELGGLPECPANTDYEDFNPFTAQCLPGEVNIEEVIGDFKDNFTHSEDIADQSFSSDDIEWDEDALETAPEVFSAVKNLPWFFLIGLSLFGAGVVLASKSFKHGLRKLSALLFWPGLFFGLIYLLLRSSGAIASNVSQNASSGEDPLPEEVVENIVRPVLDTVVYDIATTGLMIASIAAVLGALIWIGLHTWHKTKHEAEQHAKGEVTSAHPEQEHKLPPQKVEDTTPTEKEEDDYIKKISK